MSSSFSISKARVRFAGGTHPGKKRSHNEDRFWISPDEPLAVVADGLGGHQGGEVAAALAIDSICTYYQTTSEYVEESYLLQRISSESKQKKRLYGAVTAANERVYTTAASDSSLTGMATTLVSAFFFDDSVLIAHVGDSRIYRLRQNQLTALTQDHCVQNEYPASSAFFFPQFSPQMMTRAIGVEESVAVDLYIERFVKEDIYLLCSDGLSNMVDSETMTHVLQASGSLEEKIDRLIQAANQNGGLDNISMILSQIEER